MSLNNKQKDHIAKICHSLGIGAILPLILNSQWAKAHIGFSILFVLSAIIVELIAITVLKKSGEHND